MFNNSSPIIKARIGGREISSLTLTAKRSSNLETITTNITIILLFIGIKRENRKFSGNFSYRGKKKKENRKFSGMTRDVIGFKME